MEQRWRFLAPWCAALKSRLSCNDFPIHRDMWHTPHIIHVQLPTRSDRAGQNVTEAAFKYNFRKVREALALLAAVEHVDPAAWVFLLKKYCKLNVGFDGEEKFDNISARFSVGMDYGRKVNEEDPTKVDFDLVGLCGVDQLQNPSAEYLETLQRIAAMDDTLQSTKTGVDLKIPVQVKASAHTATSMMHFLDIAKAEQEIKQQWEEYESQEVQAGSLRCIFLLEPMNISFSKNITSPEVVEIFERLVLDNVWFSGRQYLSLIDERDELRLGDEYVVKKALGQLLRRVFDCTRRSPAQANMNYHFEAEQLQLGTIDVAADETVPDSNIAALFSSTVVSQMAKHITLQFNSSPSNPLQSQFWFKWLAYGLFSKRAQSFSAVENLELNIGEMTIDDAEAFAAIVNSNHPEEELCGSPRGQMSEQDANLRDRAPIRFEFDDNGNPVWNARLLTNPTPIVGVKTFSDDGRSNWINAIVPGVGRCQVRRDDLVFCQTKTAQDKHCSGLQSLAIEFADWVGVTTAGLPRFLEAAGSSLRSLTLSGPREGPDEIWILQHCPKLEELTLSGGWIDVQLNLSFFREVCSSLDDVSPTHWHEIGAVATALSSLDNPIAQCVRRLRLRLVNRWSGWDGHTENYELRGFEQDIQPLLHILEVNKFLEFFEIHVRDEYEPYMAAFRKYHLEALPKAREPLTTLSKLAFLSVFSAETEPAEQSSKREGGSSLSRGSLSMPNQEALANIFAFAAPPVLRRVYFCP